MKPLDLTKPIQTRDGRPAKFLHKLDNIGENGGKLVFVVGNPGHQYVSVTRENGRFGNIEIPDDLINVPAKHIMEYWVNLYDDTMYCYTSREKADHASNNRRIACKKITIEFEDGEGL